MNMEERAKSILESHGCKFIKMISECRVVWENACGIVRDDDIAVLNNVNESVWSYWKFH